MQPWWLSTVLRVFRPAEGNLSFSTPLRRCAWIACAEPFYNKAQTKPYDVVSVTVVNTCRSKEGSTVCSDHNCVWVDPQLFGYTVVAAPLHSLHSSW